MNNQDGVEIPQNIVQTSIEKKTKAVRSLAQLPVYRAAVKLKYTVVEIIGVSPNKYRKFYDQMLMNMSEVCKLIGFADISKVSVDRIWYINSALVLLTEVKTDFSIVYKLGICQNKQLNQTANDTMKSITAQLVAWRSYTSGEGANQNSKE